MLFQLVIKKMLAQKNNPIKYYANFLSKFLLMNNLIDKNLKISHLGYECLNCKKNKKIKAMGYCSDCFFLIPQTGEYIFHPEKSTAHLGVTDRNLEYESKIQLQPHVVYLANSGGIKVGVTRISQIPTRWIDQGAEQVVIFAITNNRYESGIIEIELKKYLTDKTNWKKMLSTNASNLDLLSIKSELKSKINPIFINFITIYDQFFKFKYPIKNYPANFSSANFNKINEISGKLIGIKGQYLLFENMVFNWRKHEGFIIELQFLD